MGVVGCGGIGDGWRIPTTQIGGRSGENDGAIEERFRRTALRDPT